MQLPIAIHKDEHSVFGVSIPDVPGCHSWGNSIEEAIDNAQEAIYGHIGTLMDLGEPPEITASSIEELRAAPDYQGAIWAVVELDPSRLDPTPERVNISLPRFVLQRIDAYTKAHHETRSGFLARAAMKELAHTG